MNAISKNTSFRMERRLAQMKVTDGRLPEELLRHLNRVVFEEAQACSGRPPFRMEGELADFVFDVLRRR